MDPGRVGEAVDVELEAGAAGAAPVEASFPALALEVELDGPAALLHRRRLFPDRANLGDAAPDGLDGPIEAMGRHRLGAKVPGVAVAPNEVTLGYPHGLERVTKGHPGGTADAASVEAAGERQNDGGAGE